MIFNVKEKKIYDCLKYLFYLYKYWKPNDLYVLS